MTLSYLVSYDDSRDRVKRFSKISVYDINLAPIVCVVHSSIMRNSCNAVDLPLINPSAVNVGPCFAGLSESSHSVCMPTVVK